MFVSSILILAGLGAQMGGASPAPEAKKKAEGTPSHAVAVLHPTAGHRAEGTVTFQAVSGGVKVTATLKGLDPGPHGFHVHEFGDCTAPDGTSAGGHFNPAGHPHGGPRDAKRHAGDLGNIEAKADGTASLEWTDPMMRLDGPKGVVGHGVIVHAKADDLKTQPTGDAGGRLACGVIGVAKAPQ